MSESTPEVTVEQLEDALRGGGALVDVRETNEYVQGHIPGARLVPMSQLPGRVGELESEAPLYVVCASGGRSAAMTDFLRSAGFDARSIAGGTQAWASAGRPLDTGLPAGH